MAGSSLLKPPPIRACLFDMDGLLIDSEDKYTQCVNTVLAEQNRPSLPWSIKAQLQGRPGPEAGQIFQAWAKLPISEEAFLARQRELQTEVFPSCQLLPGVDALFQNLANARTRAATADQSGNDSHKAAQRPSNKVRIALATSSHTRNYDLKTAHMQDFFARFPPQSIVKGDDPRIAPGRGKPCPDIYLLALETINAGIRARRTASSSNNATGASSREAEGEDEDEITPAECLVFEDSVPGVEAGRRAGMQVVWVPHPGLWGEYRNREKEVLAGRSGMVHGATAGFERGGGIGGSSGEVDDGWARRLVTLEDFPYADFGVEV